MSTDKTDLDAEDRAEIKRLSERAKGVDRREALTTVGRALVFVLPALATFTVSPDALGQAGSDVAKTGGAELGSAGTM
ncbi:hypothetical protein ACFL3I_03550 [Pseudomonadota bacterium]